MKVTSEQIGATTENSELYLRHYGRLFRITAVTTTHDEANAHMEEHGDEGLIAERVGFCFIAKTADNGALSGILRQLVQAIDDATPGERGAAGRMLDEMYTGQEGRASWRRIARELAPVIHKLRK